MVICGFHDLRQDLVAADLFNPSFLFTSLVPYLQRGGKILFGVEQDEVSNHRKSASKQLSAFTSNCCPDPQRGRKGRAATLSHPG